MSIADAGPEIQPTSRESWSRPKLERDLNSDQDTITFQQIDLDYYIGKSNINLRDCKYISCRVVLRLKWTAVLFTVWSRIHLK